jgi:hypothetical protein
MYITYAANGSSYEKSTTKAAVMVASLAAFSFVFGLLRFRFARYWFAFTVATFRWVLRCAALRCIGQALRCTGVSCAALGFAVLWRAEAPRCAAQCAVLA